MDNQVLDWLYEHSIKHNYSNLCSGIEAEFKKRGRQPEIPKSGFLLAVRRLQVILHKDKIVTKTNLEALLHLLHDIIQYEPFQQFISFHKAIIKLWIVVKLCLVDEEGLHHDTVLKHLPYFSWDSLKSCCQYQTDELIDGAAKAALISSLQDDYYNEHYAKFIKAAHEAIEASFDKQTKRPTHLKPRLRLAMECCIQVDLPKLNFVLMGLIPTTALEKLINNKELQETFARQGGPELEILMNFTRKDITESVLREVMQALLTRAQSQIPLHATTSEKSQILRENKIALNINHNKEKIALKELSQVCRDAKDIALERKVKCITSNESVSDHDDLVIVNGKMRYMKKNIKFPQNICRVSTHEKERKISATHTNTDGLCDTEVNAKKMPISPEDLFVLTHNSKKIELVSKEVPVPVKKPFKSFKHSKTSHTQKSDLMESCMEDSDIQGLERMITTLEDFLTLLKVRLKQEKEKRVAAGLQRFGNEHNNSGDEDGDHLDHHHVSLSTVQQLTLWNSQVKDGHQTQKFTVTTNKDHNPQDSQNYQSSLSKISSSKKCLTTVVSDSLDFQKKAKNSPSKSCQDESQGNKNSDPECASLLSLSPCQMSPYIPSLTCISDRDALQLYLSDSSDTAPESEVVSVSDIQSVEILNKGSQDKSSHQQETEVFRDDKENKRPLLPTSHSLKCEITESSIPPEAHPHPNINSEWLHGATSQEYISSRKQDAVSEICKSILPSKISEISSSTVKQVADETPTCSGPLSPKQNMLQGRKRTRTKKRKLQEEKAEFRNLPLSYDSEDLGAKLKTKSHLSVSKDLKKKCRIHGTRQSLRLTLKELDQKLTHVVSPMSSVVPSDVTQSDDEVFLTPIYSPDLGRKSPFCSTSPNDISDTESWVSAKNNMASSQDIKAMKP